MNKFNHGSATITKIRNNDENILLQSLLFANGYKWTDSGQRLLDGCSEIWISGNELFFNRVACYWNVVEAKDVIKELLMPTFEKKLQELNQIIKQRYKITKLKRHF